MRVLIGNTVKTDTADHVFRTREEAEAFYMTLKTERPEPRKEDSGRDARAMRNFKMPWRSCRLGTSSRSPS